VKRTGRKLSAATKGTPERKKRRKIVSRVHERIRNRRRNFTHQESRRVVNRFDVIAVEDLSVNQMVHNHCLAKSIHDAAWSQFATFLSYKAAWAGRVFVAVNPAYTSQDCSGCGHRQKKALAERVHSCVCCGLTLDRDHNAARNILRLGLQSLGRVPRSSGVYAGE
jgi:putative transposase